MYADIVVLTYQSPEIESYTYKVPKELEKQIKPGQIVQVPFGNRQPFGIIVRLSHGSNEVSPRLETRRDLVHNGKFQIKSVSSIVFQVPLLLPYQIDLLKWLSFYHHAPAVNCLKAILPELPTRRGEGAFERVDHSIPQRGRTFGGLKGHLSASEKVTE